jgi:hypothetical protein
MAKSDDCYKKLAKAIVERAWAASMPPDPLLSPTQSRSVSAFASIQRRHGSVIPHLLADALADVEEVDVFVEPKIGVTRDALQLAETGDVDACRAAHCTPYEGIVREVQVDLAALDHRTGCAMALEVKRGVANVDASKRRSTIRDGLAVMAMMRDFAERHGLPDAEPDFRVVSMYGRSGFPPPLTVTGDKLDLYLDASVSGEIWRLERALRHEIARRRPGFDDTSDD